MSIEWFQEAVEAAKESQRGTNQNAHREWFDQQVEDLRTKSREAGQEIEDPAKSLRESLGYFSGYFNQETAQLVFDHYNAPHPFLGTPEERSQLSPQQLIEMGQSLQTRNDLKVDDAQVSAALEIIREAALELLKLDGVAKAAGETIGAALLTVAKKPKPAEPERESLIDSSTKLN
jgi:hypothetical protein